MKVKPAIFMGQLKVNNISKRFGAVVALDGVSFETGPASVVAVLGPNGAGKSTLLNCIASVLRLDGGSIEIGNARVGYLGHKSFLYDDMDVEANLTFWARLAGVEGYSEKVRSLLEASGLDRHRDKKAGALSAGMEKKLSICRAVINDPEVLILDEPFSALDESARGFAFECINDVREGGGIVLFTTHELELAGKAATHSLALCGGKVMSYGRVGVKA